MNGSREVVTNPDLERRTRRQFSAAEKQRLLAEAEALAHGDKGAWLRRNALYAGQLSTWRKTLAELRCERPHAESHGVKTQGQ